MKRPLTPKQYTDTTKTQLQQQPGANLMDIKIFYLSLRNRALLEKLIKNNASNKRILHQEKLLEKYTNEQFKNLNNIN